MRHYKVILRPEAMTSVDDVVEFIKNIYSVESAQRYRKSILFELESLSYYASIFPLSRFRIAQEIHPQARSIPILKRRWTVVYHIDEDYVIVDRIMLSRSLAE